MKDNKRPTYKILRVERKRRLGISGEFETDAVQIGGIFRDLQSAKNVLLATGDPGEYMIVSEDMMKCYHHEVKN